MDAVNKPINQKAWWLVLPVLICVAFSAIVPLMTVVNYSVQDIISPERRVFVGTEWFAAVMRDGELHAALWRQLGFSLSVLAVEIPLGIALALSMPATGWKSSAVLVVVALSLLIPWNVVGTIWQIYGRADIGLLGHALQKMGINYSYTGDATDAWLTVLMMDVWHWTPLVALLCFAGLRSIPDAYYQAARIDGASKFAVFRYIQLPKMRGVQVFVAHHRGEPLGADEHTPLGRDYVLHRVVHHRHQRHDGREGHAQQHGQDEEPGLLVHRFGHGASLTLRIAPATGSVRDRNGREAITLMPPTPRSHRSRCGCPAPAAARCRPPRGWPHPAPAGPSASARRRGR